MNVSEVIEKLQRYADPDVPVYVEWEKRGDWRPIVAVLGLYNESTQWVAIEVGDKEETDGPAQTDWKALAQEGASLLMAVDTVPDLDDPKRALRVHIPPRWFEESNAHITKVREAT